MRQPPCVDTGTRVWRCLHERCIGSLSHGGVHASVSFVVNMCVFTAILTATNLSAVSSSTSRHVCSKCGITKKSGALSCCARGGAWFNNCGNNVDTKFDHTWPEGIQACKSLVKTPPRVALPRVAVIAYPLITVEPRNATNQQTHVYRSSSVSNSDNTNCKGRVRLAHAAVCNCVLFFISQLNMH